MIKRLLIFSFILIYSTSFGQINRKKELENMKKELQKEISYVNKLLAENRKAARFSIGELKNLEIKISIRQDLINNYNEEISLLEESINSKNEEIEKLESEVELLKEEYSKIIVQSYKSKSVNNRIMFILAADNFNQALKRMRYMTQIAKYRVEQAEKINLKKEKLEKTVKLLNDEKLFKLNLVSLKELEKQELLGELSQKNGVVSSLNKESAKLEKDIRSKQSKSEELQAELQKIISEEIRLAKAKAVKENKDNFELTKEAKALSSSFSKNKNKLPWPVEKGFVVSQYGKHKHPTLKHITIVNHGVDIATEKGSSARAIFEGEVSSIIISRGGNRTVILQHGNFYTVYSNLSKIYVSKGQKVNIKDPLGEIFFDSRTGDSILKFQLWQDKKEQNPSTWIYKM